MSQENNWTQETAKKHGKEMLGLLEKEIQQQINQ